jgi:hypothetical protein
MDEQFRVGSRCAGAQKGLLMGLRPEGVRTGPRECKRRTLEECPPHTRDMRASHELTLEGTCLTSSSTAPPQKHPRCTSTQRPALRLADQTGESIGAHTPCECSPRALRLAARKSTSSLPHLTCAACGMRESFERHILPLLMPCLLASSFSREHSEAYTLLDLQRPASDWASWHCLPSFCDTSLQHWSRALLTVLEVLSLSCLSLCQPSESLLSTDTRALLSHTVS